MTEYTPKQQRLIEKHRDINVEHGDWWDCTYDSFIEDMALIGFDIASRGSRQRWGKQCSEPAIYFSGFWSQGDGACFEGSVTDMRKFIDAADLGTAATILADRLSLSVRTGGNYCHSGTMSADAEIDDSGLDVGDDEQPDDVKEAMAVQSYRIFDLAAFEQGGLDFLRRKADELYRQLEEEHTHLTSDEAVWDSIEANELDKDEEDEDDDED